MFEALVLPHLNPTTVRLYSGTTLSDATRTAHLDGSTVTTQRDRARGLVFSSGSICTTNAPWALERALHEAIATQGSPIILETSLGSGYCERQLTYSPDKKRNSLVYPFWSALKIGRVWIPNEEQDWKEVFNSLTDMEWDEAGVELAQILKDSFHPTSARKILIKEQPASRSGQLIIAA